MLTQQSFYSTVESLMLTQQSFYSTVESLMLTRQSLMLTEESFDGSVWGTATSFGDRI